MNSESKFLILYFAGWTRSYCLGPWELARPLGNVICKNLLTFRNTHSLWSCHPALGISPAEMKSLECKATGSASQVALVVKNLPVNAGDSRDSGSIPGSPGGENSKLLQCSGLENSMGRQSGRLQFMGLRLN